MWRAWEKRKLKDARYSFLFDPYEGDEVVVFDTETTGLNPKKDALISIGAVTVKGNKILTSQSLHLFIKPTVPLDAKSIAVHHIRPCDLETALLPQEGVRQFLEFVQNRPVAGYYLEFDIAMLNQVLVPWLGIKLPNKQTEVSGLYFDKKIGWIPQGNIDLRFDTILANLDLPTMGRHNALNDAIMTAMIYLRLQSTTHQRSQIV